MPSSTSSSHGLPPDIEKQVETAKSADHSPTTSDEDAGLNSNGSTDRWAVSPEPELLDTEAGGVTGAISRVLSRISTNASCNPGPPPDGGRKAWVCALCGHLIIANTWGFINSFGVFQSYYTSLLGRTPSDVSWIGSIQVFLIFGFGAFTGRLADAGFFRPVSFLGTFFMTLGLLTTSFATQYWQFILAQGLCMGIGSGCLFTPTMSVTSTYFEKKRSLALGITASGSVTGGLIFPAMARQLLPSIGFSWTVRAMALVQLVSLLFANMFMKSRVPPRKSGSWVEWGAFKELEYTFYAAGMFFNFWALYFGFFYIPSFSREAITPPLSYTDSLNLLMIVNSSGFLGRIIPNYLADTAGPLNMMIPMCLATGLALLAWIAVRDPPQLYIWVIFYGIAAGGIQSLFPAGLSSLTADLRKRGTRMGMTFTIVSFAVLTGNPIAGAIITAQGGSYVGAQVFTGISIMLGLGFILAARLVRQRHTGSGWRIRM